MAKRKLKRTLDKVSSVLLIVGGLVHLGQAFGYYAVDKWFASVPLLPMIVYLLVGASAVWAIARWVKGNYMR